MNKIRISFFIFLIISSSTSAMDGRLGAGLDNSSAGLLAAILAGEPVTHLISGASNSATSNSSQSTKSASASPIPSISPLTEENNDADIDDYQSMSADIDSESDYRSNTSEYSSDNSAHDYYDRADELTEHYLRKTTHTSHKKSYPAMHTRDKEGRFAQKITTEPSQQPHVHRQGRKKEVVPISRENHHQNTGFRFVQTHTVPTGLTATIIKTTRHVDLSKSPNTAFTSSQKVKRAIAPGQRKFKAKGIAGYSQRERKTNTRTNEHSKDSRRKTRVSLCHTL